MKIATGTVKAGGSIVVEGDAFAEGEKVTVLSHVPGATFRVTADEKRQLLTSIAEAERGEFVDADDLLAEVGDSN